MKRPLLRWSDGQPAETSREFDERTGRRLHLYPDECLNCGTVPHAVITYGFPDAGEAWCLKCGRPVESG